MRDNSLVLIYRSLRYFRQLALKHIRLYYQIHLAPFLAKNMAFLFWPAYKLLKMLNICFLVNIANGMGHTPTELDNFFRRQYLGEIDFKKHYVLTDAVFKAKRACAGFYRKHFYGTITNEFINYLLLPITMRYKDITLDCGLARIKWQLTDDNNYFPPKDGQTYLYRLPKEKGISQWVEYYKRKQKTPDYFPLKDYENSNNAELMSLLNGRTEKIALVHVRLEVMNATADPADPETYLDALAYLTEIGYQLVFVGREKMPQVFQCFNIIIYSQSSIASFKNDIRLFNLADLAITGGSGIAFLADVLNTPVLYLNSWHLALPVTSKNNVMVPTLVRDASDKYLKFSEQIKLYESMSEESFGFIGGNYSARNATAEELLAGLQELLRLKEIYAERSQLQDQFSKIENKGWLKYSQARYSEQFLRKHIDLF